MSNGLALLLSGCGLAHDESMGLAFLSGYCAQASQTQPDFLKKVAVFSCPKTFRQLEESCGFILDRQIALDFEDFFALIAETDLGSNVPRRSKPTGRLRATSFAPSIWDTQLLCSQLLASIYKHLGSEDVLLAEAFDCGLFFQQIYRNEVGSGVFMNVIRDMCPPIIKGILYLQDFDQKQRSELTNLHVGLHGFSSGLGILPSRALWSALSYVLYEHGGRLSAEFTGCDAAAFHSRCAERLPRFLRTQAATADMLRDQLQFSGSECARVGTDFGAMISYLAEEWRGGEHLSEKRPEQFAVTQKILIFYECLKGFLVEDGVSA
jgi:hypothetical protein